MDGVVRSDIRTSIGGASGTAEGVPLTINLVVTDASTGAPMQGAAVYAWHCDRSGSYSMYNGAAANENYLRGVQPADASGNVAFTTVFPAAYSGRWPHVHLEVFSSVDEATGGGQPVRTTQLAFPADVCSQVYTTTGYEQSVTNLAQTSLQTDMVFGDDGGVHELATMSGSAASGLVATLAVPI
jgi:protocatechuate 3,4-dioxygenase beta subunit